MTSTLLHSVSRLTERILTPQEMKRIVGGGMNCGTSVECPDPLQQCINGVCLSQIRCRVGNVWEVEDCTNCEITTLNCSDSHNECESLAPPTC